MAYHGYIVHNKIQEHCKSFVAPSILEVGVDTGISTISLVHHLDKSWHAFKWKYTGIDIHIQDHVKYTLECMDFLGDRVEENQVHLLEGNSLKVLPYLVQEGFKFDVILLDGDHNYFTVQQELEYIIHLMHVDTMLICDDYDGKWSERDLFYATRFQGKEKDATEVKVTEKSGVKPAVDEFLDAHPELAMGKLMDGEPVVIFYKNSKLLPHPMKLRESLPQ